MGRETIWSRCPTAFPDWSLVGIIQADEVDGALYDVQNSSLILLGALCFFTVIIVVLALGMESRLRLKNEEMERLNLEREKMKSDRFLQSMSRIVDRYSIVNLDTGRYRYYELRFDQPLYPTSGQYSEMVEIISKRYVALIDTENAKLRGCLRRTICAVCSANRMTTSKSSIAAGRRTPIW